MGLVRFYYTECGMGLWDKEGVGTLVLNNL
jgi:hypothetical protein